MQIAVLTVYTNEFKDLAECTLPIMEEYCNSNEYQFYPIDISGTPVYYGFKKIEWIKFMFNSGQADIILAIDLDVLLTNHKILIEDFVDNKHDFFITKDINGINAGSFIIKKSDTSIDFLSDILSYQHEVQCEQEVIEQLIFRDKYIDMIEILPHPSINSYLYEEYGDNYGKIVGVQKSKPTHIEGQWEPGDFALHLPGIPNSIRIEIFETIKTQIKR